MTGADDQPACPDDGHSEHDRRAVTTVLAAVASR